MYVLHIEPVKIQHYKNNMLFLIVKKMIEKDTKDGKLEIPKFPDDMLFAPDAIYKNDKYYLYFCMADSSEGVAIADKPEGPFDTPVQSHVEESIQRFLLMKMDRLIFIGGSFMPMGQS